MFNGFATGSNSGYDIFDSIVVTTTFEFCYNNVRVSFAVIFLHINYFIRRSGS